MNSIATRFERQRKFSFFIYSMKKNILTIIFVLFTISLVIFSQSCLLAAKNGLKLWATNVIPALFPFFIATELLSYTNIINKLSKLFSRFMAIIFNVPGNCAYAFIIGIISGYPIGAKVVTDLRNAKLCSKDEGERMLAFTNNSGPLFIIGTVGILLFRSTTIGILLLITHILSAITVGFILRFFGKPAKVNNTINIVENKTNYDISSIGSILSESILKSIKNILLIGGFIVLFSVIISVLNTSNVLGILSYLFYPIAKIFNIDIQFFKATLTGILEITNGISAISSITSKYISINIIITAFLLGFGGISVLFQVLSIISKSDLSIKTYIYGKFIQGIIAAIYTYIFITSFGFFNFNL